jgi:hypothetical protein
LSIKDDAGNDHPQLSWDHHNDGMSPLTQRTKAGVEALLSLLEVKVLHHDLSVAPQPATALTTGQQTSDSYSGFEFLIYLLTN